MILPRFNVAPRAALVIGLALVALCGQPVRAEEILVHISNFTFAPPNLTVKAGTSVTFQNDDDIPHLVVANDGAFRSKALDTDDKFTFTFAKPGDFPYFCGMH